MSSQHEKLPTKTVKGTASTMNENNSKNKKKENID